MELQSLLASLSAQGVQISLDGDSLLIEAPKESITPELRD